MLGKVKWFSAQRGYGFIIAYPSLDEVFVHYTNIISDGFQVLTKDQLVEFTISNGRAANVTKISSE
jgi:CspA family cold shock protein